MADDDEFVLSSDEGSNDELSEFTDDDHKKSESKSLGDMEGTLLSCNDFYRLVFNDELETEDAYLTITGEASYRDTTSNGWFLSGPQPDYCPTRHILSALIGARILWAKKKARTLPSVALLESLYKICAMFQFTSLRVNLLTILIIEEMDLEGEGIMDVATQILQQVCLFCRLPVNLCIR